MQVDRLQPGDRVLLHGHRLRAEHRVPRDHLVTAARDAGRRRVACPGSTRVVAARRRVADAAGAPRTLARARQRCRRRPSTARCSASTATRPGPTLAPRCSPRHRPGGASSRRTTSAWASPSATARPHRSPSGSTTSAPSPTRSASPGPVVAVAHDWGGPSSLGWALAHRDSARRRRPDQHRGHQPDDAAAPPLIRLARTAGAAPDRLRRARPPSSADRCACRVRRCPRDVRDALAAPVRRRRRPRAPSATSSPTSRSSPTTRSRHRWSASPRASRGPRRARAAALGPARPGLRRAVPADLHDRLPARRRAPLRQGVAPRHRGRPRARRRRLALARHRRRRRLAPAPVAAERPPSAPTTVRRRGAALVGARAAAATTPAGRGRAGRRRPAPNDHFAGSSGPSATSPRGLAAAGVRPGTGSRSSSRPGADLTAAVYARWRAGAVRGRRRRRPRPHRASAAPCAAPGRPRHRHRPGLVARPGDGAARHAAIAAGPLAAPCAARWASTHGLRARPAAARAGPRPPPRAPTPTAPCSSPRARPGRPRASSTATASCGRRSTGSHDLRHRPRRRLVAAFAPFALFGPALGIASAVPDMDVTRPAPSRPPRSPTPSPAVDARSSSPRPPRCATWCHRRRARPRQREALRAGAAAHVGRRARARATLLAASEVLPRRELHTPYGMTEVLPVTDVSLEEIEAAGRGDGSASVAPLPGVEVAHQPA